MLAQETIEKATDRSHRDNTPKNNINYGDMLVFLLQDFLDFEQALSLLDTYRDPYSGGDKAIIGFVGKWDLDIGDNIGSHCHHFSHYDDHRHSQRRNKTQEKQAQTREKKPWSEKTTWNRIEKKLISYLASI